MRPIASRNPINHSFYSCRTRMCMIITRRKNTVNNPIPIPIRWGFPTSSCWTIRTSSYTRSRCNPISTPATRIAIGRPNPAISASIARIFSVITNSIPARRKAGRTYRIISTFTRRLTFIAITTIVIPRHAIR